MVEYTNVTYIPHRIGRVDIVPSMTPDMANAVKNLQFDQSVPLLVILAVVVIVLLIIIFLAFRWISAREKPDEDEITEI